jgi:hypothetical protein
LTNIIIKNNNINLFINSKNHKRNYILNLFMDFCMSLFNKIKYTYLENYILSIIIILFFFLIKCPKAVKVKFKAKIK